jgi:hypothetical protein
MNTAQTSSKSPTAPSRPLAMCYGIATKIYDAYSHTEFGAPEIAGAANLSATGGPGKSLVSDLKQYGLVEKTKAGRFVISQELKDAHAMEQGSSNFKAAAYEFVKRPVVFMKVLVDVKGKLPEEGALANNLRSTYQFNLDKAKSTAKAISESLSWAGVLDGKRNIIEPRPGKPSVNSEGSQNPGGKIRDEIKDDDEGPLKGQTLTMDIPLIDGRTVYVRYPYNLTSDEAKKIGNVLAAICG